MNDAATGRGDTEWRIAYRIRLDDNNTQAFENLAVDGSGTFRLYTAETGAKTGRFRAGR